MTDNTPKPPQFDHEALTEELNGIIADAVHDVQWPEVVAHIEAHDADLENIDEFNLADDARPLAWVIETLTSNEPVIPRAKSIRTAGRIAHAIAESIDLRYWREEVLAMEGIDTVDGNAAAVLADPGDLSNTQNRNSLRWALETAEAVVMGCSEGDVADHQVRTVTSWLEDDSYGAFQAAGENITVNLGLKMETIENLGLATLVTEMPDTRPGREKQTKKMVNFFDIIDAVTTDSELLKVRNIRHSVLFACTLFWENLRHAGFGASDPDHELIKLLVAAYEVVNPSKVERLSKLLDRASRSPKERAIDRAASERKRNDKRSEDRARRLAMRGSGKGDGQKKAKSGGSSGK